VGGWEIDNVGNTLAWTEETFRIYELNPDQVPTVADSIRFYHPEDQPKVAAAVQVSLESGESFDFEARLITAKNNLRWVRAIGKPLFRDGHTVGMRGMVQDITYRKAAEETLRLSESRFRNAFEHSAIGMALVSPEGKWLKVNKQVCDLLGYTEDELMCRTFQDITHPEDLDADVAYVGQMLAGELKTYQMEKRYFHKNGQIIWVLLAVSLVRDAQGAPLHFISQIVNITERKKAEEELSRLLTELEQKNEALKYFSYTVSHDLKAPLLTIRMFAEEITDGLIQNDLVRVKESVQYIQKGSAQMSGMIEGLLKIARLDKFVNDLEPVPLNGVLDTVQDALTGSLSTQNISLQISENLPTVFGCRIQLHEIFQNLIENAIKFSRSSHEPKIEVGCKEDTSHWNIFVKDNGIGIVQENQSRIFSLFHKLDPKSEGSGIGLVLVQRIAELHQAHVKVESPGIGLGSTFWICFPKKIAPI
jgi:PAS domain S-box-containing protein